MEQKTNLAAEMYEEITARKGGLAKEEVYGEKTQGRWRRKVDE